MRWNAGSTSPPRRARSTSSAPPVELPTIVVRPRGWHLPEKHMIIDGAPVAGGIVDFGLFFFHNARRLLERLGLAEGARSVINHATVSAGPGGTRNDRTSTAPHIDHDRHHRPSVHIKSDPATFAHNRRLP